MNKYVIDIKVTGFMEVVVEAESAVEAEELATKKVFDNPIKDLRYKTTEATYSKLGDDDERGKQRKNRGSRIALIMALSSPQPEQRQRKRRSH